MTLQPLGTLTKSPLQSVTITSASVGLIVQILSLLGIQIAPEEAAAIGASINSIITIVMLLLTIYGRWRATRKIATLPDVKVYCSPLAITLAVVLALACSASPAMSQIAKAETGQPIRMN